MVTRAGLKLSISILIFAFSHGARIPGGGDECVGVWTCERVYLRRSAITERRHRFDWVCLASETVDTWACYRRTSRQAGRQALDNPMAWHCYKIAREANILIPSPWDP
ncbi:hypothetical protein F4677DRAFT_337073 [Hypoxylon crocopeplum]|nr:hypothetical protein F4677DRAFT_337073 [Hypoxylon crocopeplum]